MRLIETWLADPERAFDLFAKFPAEETGFENPAAGMDREQFAAYVRGLRDESLGVGLPDGWVPATKYIIPSVNKYFIVQNNRLYRRYQKFNEVQFFPG